MGVILPELGDPVWVPFRGARTMELCIVRQQLTDNGDRFTVVEDRNGERHRIQASWVNAATWQPVKAKDIRAGDLLFEADCWPMRVRGMSEGALHGTMTFSGLANGKLVHRSLRLVTEVLIVRPVVTA